MWIINRQFWLLRSWLIISSHLAEWHKFGMQRKEHSAYRLLSLTLIIAVVCGLAVIGNPAPVASVTPAQTCTAWNARSFPISGVVCGGSTHALSCSPGAIYKCQAGGAQFQQNNCTLSQACPVGCLTGPTTGNLADSCFSGSPPLTLSTSNTPGGNDVTLTVALAASHPNGAIVNLSINRGDLVPGSYCAVPDLAAGETSVSFALPTAVVSASTDVTMYTNISYTDASGTSRQLVSGASILTLAPGGTAAPPPPLASFTLTPSTIGPGQVSFMDVVLSKMAPAQGVNVSVSSSDPSVASVIQNGQPTVLGGCTTGGGAATIAAADSVPHQATVTISANSGAPSQPAGVTHPLTVTGGCAALTCLEARGGQSTVEPVETCQTAAAARSSAAVTSGRPAGAVALWACVEQHPARPPPAQPRERPAAQSRTAAAAR